MVLTQLIFFSQNGVNVDEAAKPHSDACFAVRFLADAGVLYEIICYGLSNADKEVCSQGWVGGGRGVNDDETGSHTVMHVLLYVSLLMLVFCMK